jgi:RNA polymerase sigma-70 factor (ECF subfamily)
VTTRPGTESASRTEIDRVGESALIEAALAGDERAFRSMYRAETPAMYRLALRMTGGSSSAAEDVVQEAWGRALRALAAFERRATLRTWLSRIVARCALERVRWEQRAGETLPDPEHLADARPRGREERIDLERAFRALPDGYRAVLVLHDIEGYTHEDIGALLGVSTGTSKSQLSRGRAWLRQALGQDYRLE